jgi:hypothetical protein
MGRLIAVVTAFTLLIPAAPAAAAEVTRVISSGTPDHAFGLDLSLAWDRTQRTATITREYAEPSSPGAPAYPFATVKELQQLRYTETTNLIVPRVAVGLWEDLQLAFELPYYLSQETSWRAASGVGDPGLPNTIADNMLDPDGSTYPPGGPHDLFPTSGTQTVFHGGVVGDLKVGLSWAPFAQRRDDTKPTWVVGVELTAPTAKLYDPAAGRNPTDWGSPYTLSSTAGPVGQKVWRYTLLTALSRRMGPVDPYFKANLTVLQKSSATYSNCDHAAFLVNPGAGYDPQMKSGAEAACAASPDKWGARLPFMSGLTFGVEFLPYEDAMASQKIAVDLRLSADYTSASRWYNELTDATGKLLATSSYMTLTARAGVLFRASEYVSIQAAGSIGWVTPHYLTGEDFASRVENPNFDWRYDAPERRFRATSGSVVDLQVTGLLAF